MWERYENVTTNRKNCNHQNFFLAKFLNSAARVVKYSQEQPLMRDVTHSKYLKAKTVFRSYHHITKIMVEGGRSTAGREVECLAGN